MALTQAEQIEIIKLRITNIERILAVYHLGFINTLELEDEINACAGISKKSEALAEAKSYKEKIK